MKKNIVATVVGTLIIFLWQGFSWMASPIHSDAMKQTPNDGAILQALQGIGSSGAYYVPGRDKNMTAEEMEAMSKEMLGKPWALIFYNTSFEGMSASNMFTGIFLNLLSVILAIVLFHTARAAEKPFASRLGLILILPLFCILQAVLTNCNWWSFPWHWVKGEIIDLLAGWLLFGLFAGWYLKSRASAAS